MKIKKTSLGSRLSLDDQKEVLSRYCHRYTRDHKPQWAKRPRTDGSNYPVQFASDQEWLANTEFAVTKTGRLDRSVDFCDSRPTWPDGGGPKNES